MKLTTKQLKKLIKEEMENLQEYATETVEVGQKLLITISEDGYDKSIETEFNESDFVKSPWDGEKFLVQVVKIFGSPEGQEY